MTAVSSQTFSMLMPEILLVLAAIWIFVSGTFPNTRITMPWIALMGIGSSAIGLWMEAPVAADLYRHGGSDLLGPVTFDLFGYGIRCLTLVVGLMFVAMTINSDDDPEPELLGSLLLVLSGLMLVSVATDLILLFLGLELISIPTYILLFLGRRNADSEEATLKYFFLGILSSAIMLYGFSFLYGVTGSLRLDQIQTAWLVDQTSTSSILLPVAMVLILAGLCFKMAVVPFHFYAPDVYQGTTNMNAGVLAIIPKVAGLVALIRIGMAVLPEVAQYAWQVLLVLSILSMTIGNVVALWQNNIRRLLAYSSIAQGGTMLIGLAVWVAPRTEVPVSVGRSGLAAAMMYLGVYVAAGVGTFATLVYLGRRTRTTEGTTGTIDKVDQLSGLGRTNRVAAVALAVFMFSFTGIPPLAGFWGKLELFASALSVPESASCRGWFVLLAVVGAINAAISAAYYLRVVAVMYFRDPNPDRAEPARAGAAFSMGFAALLVVAIGIYPGPLIHGAKKTLPESLHTGLRYSQSSQTSPIEQDHSVVGELGERVSRTPAVGRGLVQSR